MKVVGVIAEYNPFHNGHEYMLEEIRRKYGATHIVVVMSGNAVQRGDIASFEKHTRARAALECGADLIIELPVLWAVSRAERFALGGVSLLNALGCCDYICCGVETEQKDIHLKCAEALLSDSFSSELKGQLENKISFAAAREQAMQNIFGEQYAALLCNPNDILAVEYCKALIQTRSRLELLTVKRTGAQHNEQVAKSGIASASFIRQSGNYNSFVPGSAARLYETEIKANHAPADIKNIDRVILYKLKSMSTEQIAALPDISEGLEHRIANAASRCSTSQQLADGIKSKRYSHARIRRIMLSAVLELTEQMCRGTPPYLRVLGFNQNGRELLPVIEKNSTLPLLTTAAQLIKYGGECYNAECRTTELFNLCTPTVIAGENEQTRAIVTVNKHLI